MITLEQSTVDSDDFFSYVEGMDASGMSEMLMSRVIPSFLQTVRNYNISNFSDTALKYWYVDMTLKEMKPSTAKRYMTALGSLYKEWIQNSDISSGSVDIFAEVISKISVVDISENLRRISDNSKNISNITKITAGLKGEKLTVNSAFQYLLYNPMVGIPELVNLKFSDRLPDSPQIQDIVMLMKKMPQAKYVFPLFQGKKREPAIIKGLVSSLHLMARGVGMNFGGAFSRESITSLWIHSALQTGIPITSILGIVKVLPPDYSFLSVLEPALLTEEEKNEVLTRVADVINNKTPRWFVMKLRSGVTPSVIKESLEQQKSPLRNIIQYFYPMRHVKKMVKKKIVTVETPYLPDLLFFKISSDKVSRLMGSVGEHAWCFRTSNSPTSSYSAISQEEMAVFQRCIGSFSEDVKMEFVSKMPELKVGDKVLIEDGGQLDGLRATISKVRCVDGSVYYTLRLSDSAFIRWKEFSLPSEHLAKIE